MQRDKQCVVRVHPSQASFQCLRWIRGKWLCCKNYLFFRVEVENNGRDLTFYHQYSSGVNVTKILEHHEITCLSIRAMRLVEISERFRLF